ncbi:universal stress protein UspA-like protein [Desulfosporosinus orientis DSM 765]|uniref:Universal stress protein UspA-like protein n=1 Tax=Desulfosporosinus orientis (strain ATCC 19365 / DSM 765 / NCIMB 8382 / VKM B-1628 / Singapore I) TaxID=768706 RepID=G7WAC0_DESOD|nr:universal stress protein [Desulfosporosinus orientis]AET66469.1 universal stress protein UspA-like protein [Desulfosporosinus orientis DSM 765]
MYKRILVPTDGSGPSRQALKAALELAGKFDSEVELFHVTPDQESYYGYQMGFNNIISQEEIEKNGEMALEVTLKDIDISGVRFSKKYISGQAASGILDEVRREFDLVVMGTVGHGALTGAILGSVTQRVLAQAQCPVLIVK